MFDRDFPLGVEDRLLADPWHFAVEHSGIRGGGHRPNTKVTFALYVSMLAIISTGICYLFYLMVGKGDLWSLEEGTMQDYTNPSMATTLTNARTKDRGTVASCLTSLSFSLMVNALLDK